MVKQPQGRRDKLVLRNGTEPWCQLKLRSRSCRFRKALHPFRACLICDRELIGWPVWLLRAAESGTKIYPAAATLKWFGDGDWERLQCGIVVEGNGVK